MAVQNDKTKKPKPASRGKSAPVAKTEARAEKTTTAVEKTAPALGRRPVAVGIVVSDKMQKTIVVKVERRVKHGMYGKYVVRSQRYKAHDEENSAKVGDLVSLVQSRPLSKDKRWALQKIVRRGNQTAALETV